MEARDDGTGLPAGEGLDVGVAQCDDPRRERYQAFPAGTFFIFDFLLLSDFLNFQICMFTDDRLLTCKFAN